MRLIDERNRVMNQDNQLKKREVHEIEPVFDRDSKILILGSFPSVKSREAGFFYHHPQNRFWKILSVLTGDDFRTGIEEKRRLLLKNHIAVWDVIDSCQIKGSSDSSITDVIPADIGKIVRASKIQKIFTNGNKADSLYKKYIYPELKMEAIKLPSTSPANATYSLERLLEEWKKIME